MFSVFLSAVALKGDKPEHHYLQKVRDINPSEDVFYVRAEEGDNVRDIAWLCPSGSDHLGVSLPGGDCGHGGLH